MIRSAAFAITISLAGSSAVAQQPQPRILPVSADGPYAHANSGLAMPTMLAGLPRTQVREFEGPELDVNGTYTDDGRELTVYVYRTLAGAVPVWFDRAGWAIATRDGWGKLTPIAAAPVAVAPPGSSVASGLAQAWSIDGGKYRGTAVALLPLGEWLVKLRYSNTTEDGAQALARLRTALASLTWPAAARDGVAATPVADCADGLTFAGTAKPIKADAKSVMMGALLAAAAGDSQVRAKSEPAATWCRDAATVPMGAVYRPDAKADTYLLALSDAGRGIQVGPTMNGLFDKKKAKPSWGIDLVLPGRTLVYPQQDRLPAPAQVMAIIGGPATSSITTWGSNREVTLPSDMFKGKK